MRLFYDFEFVEDGQTIDPVSVGMVREDGTELYAVFATADEAALTGDPWLRDNVWVQLPTVPCPPGHRCLTRGHGHLDLDHPAVRPPAQIRNLVGDFIQDTPDVQLWADHSAYDHVALAQLWGRMVALPTHVPMFTSELQQEARRLGAAALPAQEPGTQHHALLDARYDRDVALYLDALAAVA